MSADTPTHVLPNAPDITAAILAGGAGSRMGGVEKGLHPWHDGQPLIAHVIARIVRQVDCIAIINRRSQAAFSAWTPHVWPDRETDSLPYPGPLAGIETAVQHCTSPWLLLVPCDAPFLPLDLASRLHTALCSHPDALIAVATTPASAPNQPDNWHPTCLLLRLPKQTEIRQALQSQLTDTVNGPDRSVRRWILKHPHVALRFNDVDAFRNINSVEDMNVQHSRPVFPVSRSPI